MSIERKPIILSPLLVARREKLLAEIAEKRPDTLDAPAELPERTIVDYVSDKGPTHLEAYERVLFDAPPPRQPIRLSSDALARRARRLITG